MKIAHVWMLLAVVAAAMTAAQPTLAEDQVRLNRTIETLEAGEPVFGIFTGNFSLASARGLARSELDFIFIDMEHSAFNMETLQTFLIGMTDKSRILAKGNGQMDVTP
ncbi:MAG: hypothetical protein ACNA7W_19500, partial [Pseudomonadales bacterium]